VESEDLDFQELAKEIGMGYDNFRRRFKQLVGMSPHQYFITQKVERAKELLLFTDLEIKDVALQLGFSDPYYFSRFFKERTNTSPAHFRKGDREAG
jgi:transcriptional regulator GlxA family with amidase domain